MWRRPVDVQCFQMLPATTVAIGAPDVIEGGKSHLAPSLLSICDNFYRYTPLGAHEFRLVRPLAPDSDRIKCEILHRSFQHPPSYVAISYAWGDPSDTTEIWIRDENSSKFVGASISKSLYYALEALWGESEDVLVWADALSIHQQNPEEKNAQLPLMADIYKKARFVAVWLGPEENDSDIATAFVKNVVSEALIGADAMKVKEFFSSRAQDKSLPALAALFEREYWNRLWVVQEIFNASYIHVFCGSSKSLRWDDYQTASRTFQHYKKELEDILPRSHSVKSRRQYSYSQILAYSGPGSLPEFGSLDRRRALLEILRVCRRKRSSDPRDQVFGVLGVLHPRVRNEFFAIDYGKSVKDVYTDVVEFLFTTTGMLDVVCESIHFPVHTSSANLPTWVPDWSHMPSTSAISLSPGTKFAASSYRRAQCKFLGGRRNLLEISAVPLGSITRHGIPVGTLCTLQDYLMAFLHWRALLRGSLASGSKGADTNTPKDFCKTICFGQIPPEWEARHKRAWMEACFHVFARLIQERLPYLAIDDELAQYVDLDVGVMPEARRKFLYDHFGSRMMGRCFCLTSEGRMGLGTGFMAFGDRVVVPLGCSTPVLLRPEGNCGEYRFVGDIYINDYMHGEAIRDLDSDKRQLKRYVIH